MNVGELSQETFARRLTGEGVAVRTGPFISRITTSLPELATPFRFLYADFPLDDGGIADFHVRVVPSSLLRRRWRPKVDFLFDGARAFQPFPRRLALPLLEWGLNWCVYHHANQFLIVHAAVAERDGRAIVLPGRPGAGKSTLCAALVTGGWRLLSDEFALVRPADVKLAAIPRPMSLKDRSIEVVRRLAPDAVFGPACADTRKGTVAHMKPPVDSVRRAGEPAMPAWIVFPAYDAEAETRLEPLAKARAFFRVADNAFNYHVLGRTGFEAVSRLIDGCVCYELPYSSLEDALALLDGFQRPEAMTARR
ncbi:MAG: HprK-related kinase A [Alphaproteobacteria bacterium]